MLDLVGKRFGRLVAIECIGHQISGYNGKTWRWRRPMWLCKCDCGNTHVVLQSNLQRGLIKSCGCYKIDNPSHLIHGLTNTRLFKLWCHIKERCNNPNSKAYKYYGARGIKLCEEWSSNVENFIKWALSCPTYTEEMSIERINVDKGYSPDNCTWIIKANQAKNRRPFRSKYANGQRVNIKKLALQAGISYKTVKARLYDYGWSFEDAITIPVRSIRNYKNEKNK